MALAQEDIEYIKTHIGVWLAEQSLGKPPLVYEIELRERMVRAEEELWSLSLKISVGALVVAAVRLWHRAGDLVSAAC